MTSAGAIGGSVHLIFFFNASDNKDLKPITKNADSAELSNDSMYPLVGQWSWARRHYSMTKRIDGPIYCVPSSV